MGRGRATPVSCSACGRAVPRGKAVVDYRPIVFTTDLRSAEDVKFVERIKAYYCISCAKSLGVFVRKQRQRRRFRR